MVSKLFSFLRKHLQCRFGTHWRMVDDDPIAGICSAGKCSDCGYERKAVEWSRMPECKTEKILQKWEIFNRDLVELRRSIEQFNERRDIDLIKSMQVLNLQEVDVLVLKTDAELSEEDHKKTKEKVSQIVGIDENKIIFMTGGVDIGVLRKEAHEI